MIDQRPINNIVDVTNYVMFDIGQPLHAFDYDELLKRSNGKTPTIITRTAKPGEKITTLDGEERKLEDYTVLVCDTAGSTSIAGIMGGMETEVTEKTKNVLLEGANWNYINIRKSLGYLRMSSEASYRFSRGVHPAMAERGVCMGLELMRQWSGGVVCQGLVDEYPLKREDPTVEITSGDVRRWLGIDLSGDEIAEILGRLGFESQVDGETVLATTPDHRLDIDEDPVTGKADLMEEISRIYGYENIPETRLRDQLPVQRNNMLLDFEENVRDLLVRQGIQETISYRLTSPEREARRLPPDVEPDLTPYVELLNPIAVDRHSMRKSLMASIFETVEGNSRISERIAIFEIGYVYLASEEGVLPDEHLRLGIALTGPRQAPAWQGSDTGLMDFYDLKGVAAGLLDGLHIKDVNYIQYTHPIFHPGKCASIEVDGKRVGVLGEVNPLVHDQYDFSDAPVLGAFFYLDTLFEVSPVLHEVTAVSAYPPVLEDIALVVDANLPAAQVEAMILQTGGKALTKVRLFDVYQGEQIGEGKKSLAYSLTYQAEDRTLTDKDVAKLRKKIVGRLGRELGAQLRS
jgi:phenylalanyl-tRNA synthetase beta chain